MNMYDLIVKKKRGGELVSEEIHWMIREYTAGNIPDYQMSAMMMAICFVGMTDEETKDLTLAMAHSGDVLDLSVEELKMGYRTSVISKNDYVALSAVLKLDRGEQKVIRARMEELKEKRVEKQPLEYGSAGSAFRRPKGYFAGKLIQDAGLRGYRVGNAQVSEKHCGFVINRGGATAAEIVQLMTDVEDRVEEMFGVRLEPEVRRIGEF